jgi:AbrB family looped-hinge helix DNA binding protein
MPNAMIVNDARVMSKGQVTIPKNIRSLLGIKPGDRVSFIFENGSVRVVNSAIYALEKFQKEMAGQAAAAGFLTEDDVAEWITKSRRSENPQ